VIICIFRYLQITLVEHRSGAPTMILFKDLFMQIVILCWLINYYLLIYVFGH